MLRKIVSLTLTWMFVVSSFSGVMLYISPPGRIAYWSDWSLLFLTKSQWDNLHTVTTLLMIIVVLLHLYYNWKPFISYMRDKVTKVFTLTKELLISIALTATIAIGAVYQLPPFSSIVDFGDYVSEEWEAKYGTPPYGHAELDTVRGFSKRLQIDYEEAKGKLQSNNISFHEKHTLLEVAKNHDVSPQKLYGFMAGKNQEMPVKLEGSGMGRKTLTQVCESRGLEIESVLLKLQSKGITANKNQKFKEIAEENGISPMDILQMIEE